MADNEQGSGTQPEEVGLLRALMGRLDEEQAEAPLPTLDRIAPAEGAPPREASPRHARRLDRAPEDLAPQDLAIISRVPQELPATGEEPRSVAGLVAELQSPEVGRRRAFLRSLRDRPLDMATAAVAASALEDPEREIRLLALDVLKAAPHLAPFDALAGATGDAEAEVRARALLLLGQTGNPSAIDTIQQRVRDESDDRVIGAAVEGLGHLVRIGEAVGLEGSVLDEVVAIVSALPPGSQFRFGEQVGAVARALPEEEVVSRLRASRTDVRVGAAMLALERNTEGALRALGELANDELTDVRRLATVARSRLQGEEDAVSVAPQERVVAPPEDLRAPVEDLTPVVPALLDALEDPAEDVRRLARETLGRMEASPARTWLREQLRRLGPSDIVRLTGHVVRLEATELLPAVAGAAVTVAEGPERQELAKAFRQAEGVGDVVLSWAADPDADRRADAVRLAFLVAPENLEPVERGLDDSSATVRLAAIDVCGQEVDGPVAERLLRLVDADSSPLVRRRALLAFRGSPLHRRLGAADTALRSPDREVRLAAVELLAGGSGDEASVLARLVRDPDQEVAAAAVRTLSAHPTGETLVTLWTSLGSAEPAVRDRILDVLVTFDRASLSRLADQAVASPVAGERTAGLAVMSRLDPDGAVPRLIDSLQDPAPEVRVEALSSLQAHPSTIAVDAVGERLRDPQVKVRALAAAVLDATPDDRVVPYLVEAASDSAEEVRGMARGAILSRRSASVARSLIGSLSVAAHRRAASDLLGAMSEESRELLLDAVDAADPEVLRAIGESLAAADQEGWVVEQLEDRHPRRRRDAVEALGAMGSSQAVPALIRRLEDPDGGVRRQVSRVLGELGDKRAVEPLRQAFVSDPDLTVVAEIEPALRRLAGGNAEGDRDD